MEPEKKFKVCLMGASMGTGNKGVSALASSLVKLIKKNKPGAFVSFFTGNRISDPQEVMLASGTLKIDVVNHRLSPKAKPSEHLFLIFFLACIHRLIPLKGLRKKITDSNRFLGQMHQCDFAGDIFGGDSFSDIYGLQRLLFSSLTPVIALLLGKKLVLFPQTYGPYKSTAGKFIATYIISHSSAIFSRDRDSIITIEDLTGDKFKQLNVLFCPDVAFMLDSIMPHNPDIQPPVDITDKSAHPLIGFNINGLMYNGGYTRSNMFGLKIDFRSFAKKLLKTLLAETDARILLVPHTFGPPGNINSDPDASRDVLKSLNEAEKNRVCIMSREYNQSEIKGIIGNCDFFIGSRMHSCIAALSQSIPTVGVAYSKKFIGVFDSIGSGDSVVDARKENENTITEKILDCYKNREQIRPIIKKQVAEAQKLIMETFNKLLKNKIIHHEEHEGKKEKALTTKDTKEEEKKNLTTKSTKKNGI